MASECLLLLLKTHAYEKGIDIIDIIGVFETILDDGYVTQAEISIEGYTMHRKDRYIFKERKAGGVLLSIRNEIIS